MKQRPFFLDPDLVTYPDQFHSDYEERYISIGYSAKNRILLAGHTELEETENTLIIRIINSRKSTPQERKNYEEN